MEPAGIAQSLASAVRESAVQLQRMDEMRAVMKANTAALDTLEDKLMASSAIAAAASGTPEEARAIAAKTRSKMWRAAANGADVGALEAMARDMERLAKIAEENRQREKRGGRDASAVAIPVLATLGKA